MGYRLPLALLAAALVAASTTAAGQPLTAPPPATLAPYVALDKVAEGLAQPLFFGHAGDSTGRMFVVERAGRVRIISQGKLLGTPFLDLTALVGSSGSEQGLLGLAFHPHYASNGLFYVDYTDKSGNTVVARYQVSADPDVADPGSAQTVLSVAQPAANHNGGMLVFGPDGFLYIGLGDGGGAGDPNNNAQSLDTLLGKILRLDIDSASPYAIPPSNPFNASADPNVKHEIWAYGLRNPWRFSFDRQTGDLFIGDVGQGRREEVDFQPAGDPGGENYGWRVLEGSLCYNPSTNCDRTGMTMPVVEYDHSSSGGCSITGGYVYRGSRFPELQGTYFYGDFCSGRIWGLTRSGGLWSAPLALDTASAITSFGEDEAGELYVLDFGGGTVYRLVLLTFTDVPLSYWAYDQIEALYRKGYVAGCSADPRMYCPERILIRSESAVFILRGSYGSISTPPYPAPSAPTFADVAPSYWGYGWIESLWTDGFTKGCATDRLIFCPLQQHTRAEGSVFFLRIQNGVDYTPPAPTGVFSDVDPAAWYAGWVEAAYSQGLLPECGQNPLTFCPEAPLNRAWAAHMMVQAKGGLPLP